MHDNDTDHDRNARDQGVADARQMADGAARFASGARGYINHRLIPAAAAGTKRLSAEAATRTSNAGGVRALARNLAPWAIVAAAIVAAISLFMPVASMGGLSISYMSMPSPEGPIQLILLLATIAVTGFNVKSGRTRTWSRIASGIAAIVLGLPDTFSGLTNLSTFGFSFASLFL
ncbi:hypothetical protein [Arthrobacter castelli]|uniref:hypothetical protein n=1 Tax=Arthrobacter castelli TaxID=271431 RepID=UPI00041390F0|nr:hypothetical protein [Arthrobacter castelli]